jgi:hypothetical protein
VEPIEIPPELGGGAIGPGTVNSEFNFDIIKLKYEYSFFLDDRLDLNAGLGAFIMPIEFGVQAIVGGVGSRQLAEDITTATLSTFTPPFPPPDKRVEIQ